MLLVRKSLSSHIWRTKQSSLNLIPRLSLCSTPNSSKDPTTKSEEAINQAVKTNPFDDPNLSLLYDCDGSTRLRLILLSTGINSFYWGMDLSLTVYDNIKKGLHTFPEVLDGTVICGGLFVTSFAFLYFGHIYSTFSVYRCYENTKDNTIRIQVYNFMGNPGKSYVIPLGNASIIDIGRSDAVGVRVEGLGKNLIFSNAQRFQSSQRLQELFNISPAEATRAKSIAWRKRPKK